MRKVTTQEIDLADDVDRLAAERRLLSVAKGKFSEAWLSTEYEQWTKAGVPAPLQTFMKARIQQAIADAYVSAADFVMQFVRVRPGEPVNDPARLRGVIALCAELDQITAALRAEAATQTAMHSAAQVPVPQDAQATTPSSDPSSTDERGPDATKPPSPEAALPNEESIRTDIGDSPIRDICTQFLAKQVERGALTQEQSKTLDRVFYTAMLTCGTNLHTAAMRARHDERFRTMFFRTLGELARCSPAFATIVTDDSMGLEAAARNVH